MQQCNIYNFVIDLSGATFANVLEVYCFIKWLLVTFIMRCPSVVDINAIKEWRQWVLQTLVLRFASSKPSDNLSRPESSHKNVDITLRKVYSYRMYN